MPDDRTVGPSVTPPEPFAARMHWIPRALRGPQAALVRTLRYYFEHAPGWVLLTTRGRKTGLPREVLLPCERTADGMILISTYGKRSDWVRNIQRNPQVQVTCAGWVLPGEAELVEELGAKQALVTAHPFFPALPVAPLHFVFRALLRPLLVLFLRHWVAPRPVIFVRANQPPPLE